MWILRERHDSEEQMKKAAVFPQRGNLRDEKQILCSATKTEHLFYEEACKHTQKIRIQIDQRL